MKHVSISRNTEIWPAVGVLVSQEANWYKHAVVCSSMAPWRRSRRTEPPLILVLVLESPLSPSRRDNL